MPFTLAPRGMGVKGHKKYNLPLTPLIQATPVVTDGQDIRSRWLAKTDLEVASLT